MRSTSACATPAAQWLARRVLQRRRVLAVAGTHGKTTTTALLAYLLDRQGRDPGFLIGGVPQDFPVSARLGSGEDFVIEADEYDTAFFDKRSKFVHYRPTVAILNNLEYDHADIFPDLAAIQRQFHHLVRIVPGNGRLIVNGEDAALAEVLRMGCWTPVERFGLDALRPRLARRTDRRRRLALPPVASRRLVGEAHWSLLGRHNVANAVAAIAAAAAVGLDPAGSLALLAGFRQRAPAAGTGRQRGRRGDLRRFRASPDGYRDHAGRPARAHRRRAAGRGDGAAQQFDAPGRACRRRCRRPSLRPTRCMCWRVRS
jgi:UDP-N-acetylmuramate: L-alanyl-gamma-D-glutamyl-meso-diaminopimelate ligase